MSKKEELLYKKRERFLQELEEGKDKLLQLLLWSRTGKCPKTLARRSRPG